MEAGNKIFENLLKFNYLGIMVGQQGYLRMKCQDGRKLQNLELHNSNSQQNILDDEIKEETRSGICSKHAIQVIRLKKKEDL
jgi:hypothetical protein